MTEDRDTQIQRLARILSDFRDAGGDPHATAAAILFPSDPPAPPAPTVVVSEEAVRAGFDVWPETKVGVGSLHSGQYLYRPIPSLYMVDILRAAFPILLRDNPWAVDAEIRRIIKKYVAGNTEESRAADRRWLLAALGVAPDAGGGR